MDWQDSGASPLKPLTDEQLAAALQGLSTEAAMQLLEEQAELRKKHAELEEVARQREALMAQQAPVPEPQTTVESSGVESSETQHRENHDFTLDLGFFEDQEPLVQTRSEEPISEPETAKPLAEEPDIAASLNAMYGAASVPEPTGVPAVEELITEAEESKQQTQNLVDDLILEFGGEKDHEPEVPAAKAKIRTPGRSAWSLLSNWNGSGSLVVAMLLGYTFAGRGNSLGSLLVGGFVAFVILGMVFAFSALAARRGNAFQQILARAAFGVSGNIIPSTVLLIARLLGVSVALLCGVLALNSLVPGLNLSGDAALNISGFEMPMAIVVAAGVAVIITGLAMIRNKAIEIARTLIAFISLGLIAAVFAVAELQQRTSYRSDLSIDLFQALALASSLLVVFGLLFAITSGDENRRIRPTTVVPKFLAAGLLNWTLIGTAALASGFVIATLDLGSVALLPVSITLAVLGVFALASIVAQTSNQLVGLRIAEPKLLLRVAISVLILGIAIALYYTSSADIIWQSLWQLLPVAGAPVAAWLGIFTADVMLRRTNYHLVSLDKNYGFYRGWNLTNLGGWLLATAAGLGFIKSEAVLLSWTGFLTNLVGLADQLALANLGIWVSFGIGLMFPICFGIPRIKKQEAETEAIEARRRELSEVLGESDL